MASALRSCASQTALNYNLTRGRGCIYRRPSRPHCSRILANAQGTSTDDSSTVSSPSHAPGTSNSSDASIVEVPEAVLFEGSGAVAELVVSLLLAATIIYIPLTIGAVGRRFWIKYRFTNKRISVINTSPLFKGQVDVSYSKVKEVRAVGRCFGLWGDMVILLKDGGQLELTAVEDFRSVQQAVNSLIQ